MCGDQNQQTAKYIHELCVEFRADLCAGRCPTRYLKKDLTRACGRIGDKVTFTIN